MIFGLDETVLVEDGTRALYVDNLGVPHIRVVEGLPIDTLSDGRKAAAGDKALTMGLPLHADMVRFLARPDVHAAFVQLSDALD